MRNCLLLVSIACIMSACSAQRYFVVRHAEKATVARNTPGMSATDPPLTDSGKQRALDLKTTLTSEKIRYVFSTNTIRTRETAEPTRAHFGLSTANYSPVPTEEFINQLKALKGNTLIVGHSNTIDDIVNKLMGENLLTDLPETEYNHLYLVTKKGKKWKFKSLTYGK
ncbi:histidine phosphatase family protein [Terrimonas sp. NA20]|uniref:Histidine phosphatase family protein n=1 Tax=Terrimonas ginsenosidimutans TaxID=2908004 RepID=A0ABS9KTN5_9BACT|nr:histidine phosphatase family protein [Terrimonas ginsenosidimutans]MCG2615655.1 histidine phosphatase family protein [Terrimonas ginsenosidimutans]